MQGGRKNIAGENGNLREERKIKWKSIDGRKTKYSRH